MMIRVGAVGLLVATTLVACATSVNDRAPADNDRGESPRSKLVIAHRGASGYLPEHTLAAKAVAHAQGADFVEQDLVMSSDDQVVVLHDIYLESVTDVHDVFPGRSREDGRYYVIDFSLAELRQLAVHERFRSVDGERTAVYEERFPLDKSSFRIATFAEEIELLQGLNQSTGRAVGIYPEIKNPAFHRAEGKDISAAVLGILKRYGYAELSDQVFLQCFDPGELQRIRHELLPTMDFDVALVQLLGTGEEFRKALTPEGIGSIASYAEGIGPAMSVIVEPGSDTDNLKTSNLVELAHSAGLVVHPYTFRRDRLPAYVDSYDELLHIFFHDLGVDGVFTDFPDLTVEFLESHL